MDALTLLIILALVILAAAFPLLLRKRHRRIDRHDREVKALNAILAGDQAGALRELREVARQDTGNIAVYIQVGDLCRQMGDAETAVRIHQDVLDREGISSRVRFEVHQHLARDFEALGRFQSALEHAQEMLKEERKNVWALKAVHRYYTQLQQWDAAIKAYQREIAVTREPRESLPALYKTQEALSVLTADKRSQAISLFKQAIKLSNACAEPYYHLGRIFQEDKNLKHAIDYFSTFAELDPSAGSLIYQEIEKMYFELGQFDQVEQFYKRLHKRQPENLDALLGLANYYERKGENREALNLLEDAENGSSENLSFVLGRLRLLEKLGREDELKRSINRFIEQDRRKRILTCPFCGHVSSEPRYLCPKCGNIRDDSNASA